MASSCIIVGTEEFGFGCRLVAGRCRVFGEEHHFSKTSFFSSFLTEMTMTTVRILQPPSSIMPESRQRFRHPRLKNHARPIISSVSGGDRLPCCITFLARMRAFVICCADKIDVLAWDAHSPNLIVSREG